MKTIILSATLLLFLASCKKEEIEDTYTVSVYSSPTSIVTVQIPTKKIGGSKCPADYTYKHAFPCFTGVDGTLKPGKWVVVKYYKNYDEVLYHDSMYNHGAKDSGWAKSYFPENANR